MSIPAQMILKKKQHRVLVRSPKYTIPSCNLHQFCWELISIFFIRRKTQPEVVPVKDGVSNENFPGKRKRMQSDYPFTSCKYHGFHIVHFSVSLLHVRKELSPLNEIYKMHKIYCVTMSFLAWICVVI